MRELKVKVKEVATIGLENDISGLKALSDVHERQMSDLKASFDERVRDLELNFEKRLAAIEKEQANIDAAKVEQRVQEIQRALHRRLDSIEKKQSNLFSSSTNVVSESSSTTQPAPVGAHETTASISSTPSSRRALFVGAFSDLRGKGTSSSLEGPGTGSNTFGR